VLLCNYNDARYLVESLGAICSQTLSPDQVVVVDDASTDDSLNVIESFARAYSFVTVLRNESNVGPIRSITRALEHASHDYVVWAAADDRLLPNFLERNVCVLERYPGAGVSFSRLAVLEGAHAVREYLGDAETGPAFDLGRQVQFLSPADLRARLARSYLWMSGNTVLARRDAVLAAGGFRADLAWHADWFAYYVVALRHGACVIPETLAVLRPRAGSYSDTGMSQRRRQAEVLIALARALTEPGYRDVAGVFRSRPTLLSPFGGLMLAGLLANPRSWAIGWRYLEWILRHRTVTCQGEALRGPFARQRRRLKVQMLDASARLLGALTPARWKE
jgi:glycosyltransferase involved in cell wall biosynthesis